MKTKLFHRITSLLLFVIFTTVSYAYDFAVDGIYYDKNTDGTSVTVTYKTSSDKGYFGSVVIPSTVTYSGKTYSVTSIGKSAFYYCKSLTSVTIGSGVTSIGFRAFYECTGLVSVTIPESVTSIDSGAFYYCSGLTKAEFASIESLCKIKFSSIDSNPLYYAKHLYINGQEVTDVVIPNSVTSIGDYAFSRCTGLTSVTIPESVTSIGDCAFYYCYGLTSVTIPESVTSIASSAFSETAWYNNQPDGLVYAGKVAYKYKGTMPSGTEIVIKEGTLEIANNAFSGCSGLTSVTIPNSVTSIGSSAFYGCTGLTSVTIPNSVTNIGSKAFYKCSGLTSVTIGNSVTTIGDEAFRSCSGLTSVTIPNSVTSIGSYAFFGTAWYGNQPDGVMYINKVAYTYKGTMPSGTEIVIKEGTLEIANNAFSGCSGLTSVTIPNSVTSIGERAFYNCTGLTSVTIPNGVTSIGYRAFYKCSSLTSVTIGNGVTSIGSDAFSCCTGLTSVTIPNSVSSIGNYAFFKCSGLTSVTIGSGVNSIGIYAFSDCSGLTKAEFASIESLCKIKFSTYDSNPLCYAKHLYINGQEVTDVVIPNSITSIYCTFSGCSGLTSVTIPNSVTSIASDAFRNCSGLTSVTIPNSVTSIGSYAFYGCSGLTSVTIPNSVTNIGNFAFYGCTGLTSVTIGSSVTSIDYSTFENCSGLTSVTCHAQNVPSTGISVFDYVPQSTATLYVPAESVEAYKSASQWKNFGTILPITPTAVESLIADDVSDEAGYTAIYDLQGRRLQHKPARGFYIQGGKKYFVK